MQDSERSETTGHGLSDQLSRRLTRRSFILLASGAALALAGCQGTASSVTTKPSGGAAPSGGQAPAPAANPTAAAAPAVAKSGATRTLRLGHTLSPTSPYQVAGQKFAEVVSKKTNGAIQVQLFPQSQLGGEVQMIDAIRTGTQEMCITAQAPMENTVKEWEIFDLPYLFDSVEQGNKVLGGPTGQKFLDMLPAYNLTGLTWISVLERDVFAGKKAIKNLADMAGFRIRVMQSPGYVEAYKALGANPTPLAYNELYLALQQGTVDGGDTSPDQFVQDKFIEVSKYFSLTHVHLLPVVLVIGKKLMDTLPADQQSAIKEAAQAAREEHIANYKKQYQDALNQTKAAGIEVDEVDVAPWKQKTSSVKDLILPKIKNGQALFDALQTAK